jgi:Tfp pilus assembly pilus retraction ATPase PilT
VHHNKRSIITQREVPEHSSTFPAGLKAAMREDCDIVLVGEMRDLETVSLALTPPRLVCSSSALCIPTTPVKPSTG